MQKRCKIWLKWTQERTKNWQKHRKLAINAQKFAKTATKLTKSGQNWPNIGQKWLKIDKNGSKMAQKQKMTKNDTNIGFSWETWQMSQEQEQQA